MVTIKLLNNNKLSNIVKNKYILCVKNYLLKIMEDVALGILESRVKLFLVNKFYFWGGILQQKNCHSSF